MGGFVTAGKLYLDLFEHWDVRTQPQISAAIELMATEGGDDERGAIFTRPEVVEFILDLVGYKPCLPLHTMRLLEPSFGGGEFLFSAVRRLFTAWRNANGLPQKALDDLSNAIQAVELHRKTFNETQNALIALIEKEGLPNCTAQTLVEKWLIQGDYLLTPFETEFDFVIGNPPYVRQELIPAPLLAEYRIRFSTLYDRADLYIPFIERSLLLLAKKGSLGLICADRWMKNKYGGPLRNLVAEHFHFKIYVDMINTQAFCSEVDSYPAITVINRDAPGPTRVARQPAIESEFLSELSKTLQQTSLDQENCSVREMVSVTNGSEPWLLQSTDQISVVRRIEKQFPLLEETGSKVGIGVATGADKVFIGTFDLLDVEPDRKLPLVTTKDIVSGEINWQGEGVVNPFNDNGGLVNLDDFPRLSRYLETHREIIAARHCAKKTPENWYRTIDRITPTLAEKPKLLIPDIKGDAHIVYEDGHLYPHHNLYYITSDTWELRALQAVLLSSITRLFVATYSTKMRGGFLRFQAQYLRRIRIPLWKDVSIPLREELTDAAICRDLDACNRAAFKLYKLTNEERFILGGNGEHDGT
jgi:hypothetical protein